MALLVVRLARWGGPLNAEASRVGAAAEGGVCCCCKEVGVAAVGPSVAQGGRSTASGGLPLHVGPGDAAGSRGGRGPAVACGGHHGHALVDGLRPAFRSRLALAAVPEEVAPYSSHSEEDGEEDGGGHLAFGEGGAVVRGVCDGFDGVVPGAAGLGDLGGWGGAVPSYGEGGAGAEGGGPDCVLTSTHNVRLRHLKRVCLAHEGRQS